MAHETRKKNLLKKHGLSGVNKPKRTPKHPKKSHVVLAQEGHTLKLIRFGQQGVSGAGKNPKSAKDKARRKTLKARHAKNIKKERCLLPIGQTRQNGRGDILWQKRNQQENQ